MSMSRPDRTVEVVPYDPSWPSRFEEEALRIRQALGENCIRIHHIGSTSVPGLDAKPVIDMIPVVENILLLDSTEVTKEMESLGFVCKGENGIPFRRFYNYAKITKPSVNVHVFEDGSPEIEHHISFRNYLCQNPSVCEEYAKLKKQLALEYPSDIGQYCDGKSDFIANIEKAAGFQGIFMRNCMTGLDWEGFHGILGIEQGITEYSKETTELHRVKDGKNFYFVLYKGPANPTAAAHIRLEQNAGEIMTLAVALKYQDEEAVLKSEFLKLLELWVKHRGCTSLLPIGK